MAKVAIALVGTSPMLMHNIQLADPDNDWAKQMAEITHKRTKTEEDRRAISKLEWYGSLYTAPGFEGPVLPTGNVRRCIINAAKVNRQGKQVERALHFSAMYVPLVYDGPRRLEDLWGLPQYQDRAAVAVSGSRTMRTRPLFASWQARLDAELIEDILDYDALVRIVDLAGRIEGIGDNRSNGYGRFFAEVSNGRV